MGLFLGVPPRFASRLSLSAAKYIVGLVKARKYSLIWLEFSQVSWLLPFARACAADAEIVLSLHDIQSELIQRKSWAERIAFGGWTRSYERRLLRQASLVRVQSKKDRDLVNGLADENTKVEIALPAISDFVYTIERREGQITQHSLLFWGAMNRTENSAAALLFLRKVLPRVWLRFPEATVYIVGANPPRELQAMISNRIFVTGYVEDPSRYFMQASLGIVPLIAGAGIKVKTLEMLAAGLTVISTAIGAEGVAPSQNLIVVEIERMADAIISKWSDAI